MLEETKQMFVSISSAFGNHAFLSVMVVQASTARKIEVKRPSVIEREFLIMMLETKDFTRFKFYIYGL